MLKFEYFNLIWFLCLFLEICVVLKIFKKEIGRVFKLILKNLEINVELIIIGDFMVRRLVCDDFFFNI